MRRWTAAFLLALTACSSGGGSSDASDVAPEDVIYGAWVAFEASWDDPGRQERRPWGAVVFVGDPENPAEVPLAIAVQLGTTSPAGLVSRVLDDQRGLTDQTVVSPTSTYTQVFDHLGRLLVEYHMDCDDDFVTMRGTAFYTEPGPASFGATYYRDPGRRP